MKTIAGLALLAGLVILAAAAVTFGIALGLRVAEVLW